MDRSTKHRESDSKDRDNQSSGRGRTATTNSFSILNQPAILTERSAQNGQILLGFKNQAPGKQANSTRYDSAGLFQFKKGNSKSAQKGYSALASKSLLSPSLLKSKEHQQSGSGMLQNSKMNLSSHQIQTQSKQVSGSSNLKKSSNKVALNSKGELEKASRQIGDNERSKQIMSPESATNRQ